MQLDNFTVFWPRQELLKYIRCTDIYFKNNNRLIIISLMKYFGSYFGGQTGIPYRSPKYSAYGPESISWLYCFQKLNFKEDWYKLTIYLNYQKYWLIGILQKHCSENFKIFPGKHHNQLFVKIIGLQPATWLKADYVAGVFLEIFQNSQNCYCVKPLFKATSELFPS